MVSLCSAQPSSCPAARADSTITALQWTMANVVARPEIQPKLRAETEIRHVVVVGACAGIQLQLGRRRRAPATDAVPVPQGRELHGYVAVELPRDLTMPRRGGGRRVRRRKMSSDMLGGFFF